MPNNWPSATGPLRTLTELGNLQPGCMPAWLLEPTHETDGASVGYKCRTHGSLGPQTIIDLAALAVEGWEVWILPRGRIRTHQHLRRTGNQLMPGPFRSFPSRHWQNVTGSQMTYARAGIFEKPDGTEEPAVAVFRDRYLLGIPTVEDAIRLSNELVDASEVT